MHGNASEGRKGREGMQMGLEWRRKQPRPRPSQTGDWRGWMTLVWLELGRGWPQPPCVPTASEEKGQRTVLAACSPSPDRAGGSTVGTEPASSVFPALGTLEGHDEQPLGPVSSSVFGGFALPVFQRLLPSRKLWSSLQPCPALPETGRLLTSLPLSLSQVWSQAQRMLSQSVKIR